MSVGPTSKDDVKVGPLCQKLLENLDEQLRSFVRPNLAEEERDFGSRPRPRSRRPSAVSSGRTIALKFGVAGG
jgi:hypothetical protein